MVLTCTATQYTINIAFILGILEKNCFIPPMDAELIGGCSRTREGYDYKNLRDFPEKNPLLKHYIINTWWLNLLGRLGHSLILPGPIKRVITRTKKSLPLTKPIPNSGSIIPPASSTNSHTSIG